MNIELEVIDGATATPKNMQDALRLNEAIFDGEYKLEPQLHGNFKPDKWIFIYEVTTDGKMLVGKADLKFLTSPIKDKTVKKCRISNLGVLPFMQHKQFGSALLEHAIEICENEHCDYVYLDCSPNKNLTGFYRRKQFAELNTNLVMPSNPEQKPTVTMVKVLSDRCKKNLKVVEFDILREKQLQAKKMARFK